MKYRGGKVCAQPYGNVSQRYGLGVVIIIIIIIIVIIIVFIIEWVLHACRPGDLP